MVQLLLIERRGQPTKNGSPWHRLAGRRERSLSAIASAGALWPTRRDFFYLEHSEHPRAAAARSLEVLTLVDLVETGDETVKPG